MSLWGVPPATAGGAQVGNRPGSSIAASAKAVAQGADILLNVGVIATESAEAAALRAPVEAFEGKRLHLVQFAGPIRPEWYGDLEATGAEVIQYIPSFAYLVYGDVSALSQVQQMAQSSASVRWDGAYLDRYKVQPAAQAETRAKLGLPADQDSFAIQLVADPVANAETLKLVDSLAAEPVRQQWEILKYRNVVVTLPVDAVASIAARPDVVSIDRHVTPQLFDERQDRIVTGQLTGNAPNPGDYLAYLAGKGFTQAQFDASGFVVDVSDSGIDNGTTTPNHFGLRVGGSLAGASRVQYSRLVGTPNGGSTLQGCDGHGNLNSHIVAGYVPDPATLPNPSVHADGSAFRYGLGVCPFVKVGSSVVFDPSTYTNPNLPNLQARAYDDNARISTNSWGADTSGAYTVEAQTFDALVRDAQPATSVFPTAGNQEMVVVFSAGNAGSGANTIGSPAVAKNVISVGASEGVQAFGGPDRCGVGDTFADSANDMATFSSRGPTDDGRFKPDIVAPGTHITGGVLQAAASVAGTGTAAACFTGTGVCGGVGSKFFPAGQQFYSASSGTSHSAPAVAGGTALVRQDFINRGLTPPSPAMTKALLVNSARYMNGSGANDTLPSNSQGMGMMNLDAYFSQLAGPRVLLDERPVDMFTASGQQRVVTGVVANSALPLRVTLAWTDPPGATSGASYVNNLDLEVSVGGNVYRGNVFSGSTSATGGAADTRNNLESVFLPAGPSGGFSVRVIATNIAGDGVPGNGTTLDQDYALVIANADVTPSLSIDDVSVVEGNAGTTTANFTVSLSASSSGTVTVAYETADGTATTADNDYLATSGTLTFDPGVTSQTVGVTVNRDTKIEPNETFFVNLTSSSGATISDGQGVGTITDDDTPPPTCTSFSLSPTSAIADHLAGSQLVALTGLPAGCAGGAWTAAGNGSWLTVSPAGGSGPGSATVSWTENAGVARTDAATIAGQTFTVTQAGPGADYFTVTPCRLVDTRLPGPSEGALSFGSARTFAVGGGACSGVSASARAVAFNLTVAAPTAQGNCRLYPGPSLPQVSSINFTSGRTRANNAVVALGPGGTVTVYCSGGTAGTVHVILDVSGYFE